MSQNEQNENQEPTIEELQAFADEKLAEYKKLKATLEDAFDEFEEELIEDKLEEYRKTIKDTKAQIREMEASESDEALA
ncbi:MAG: hypothetical protein U9N49_02785 [Campylobacterota bacterium]|nr:hypothetical protein [Campylobacterota bacterium]